MGNRILNLVFKANTSQAKAGIDELAGTDGQPGGIAGLSGALGGLVNPANLSMAALAGIGATIKDQIDHYSDYVTEVDNLSASLSLTTEEASFLMAAMERYAISNDTMVAVFRKLAAEGVDPTVDSLGELLAAYEAMPDGVEKAQFAMEMFGEQGIKQIIPWYDQLTQAQKDNFGEQVNGIEVTKEMTEQNREYKESVADLTDEFDEFKYELLGGVIPAISSTIDYVTNAIEIYKGLTEQMRIIRDYLFSLGDSELSGGSVSYSIPGLPGMAIPTPGGGRPNNDTDNIPGHATGGSFVVGGSGGIDSTPVSFMATPGETVTVGGGTNDMAEMMAEMRRMVRMLPGAITDAVQRM